MHSQERFLFCWLLNVCSAFAMSQPVTEEVLTNGALSARWDVGIAAFDEAIGYGDCVDDGGAGCPTVDWGWITHADRGSVLRATWVDNGQHAGVYFKSSTPQDLSAFANGTVDFDIRTVSGAVDLVMKIDCVWPCTSGDQRLSNRITAEWQSIRVPISQLVSGGLELGYVDTGLVFWPADRVATALEIDNVVWRTADPVVDVADPDPDPDFDPNQLSGPSSPLDYAGYSLVWSDEFAGSQLDSRYWNYNIGNSGWGNNEWQYYQRSNAALTDGYLVITARRETKSNSDYTSARIKTEGQVEFTYGRVDIRAALPRGQGIWPALWALGTNFSAVGWPYSGEIDIMEMIGGSGREDTVHGTVHWNIGGLSAPYAHTYTGGALTSGDFSAGFNVFSIIRTAEQIEWRVNDVPYYQFSIDDSASLAPFRKPFFLIFNVAVGGNWPGYPDGTTEFPQRMVVDYVRIFEPASSAPVVDQTPDPDPDADGDGLTDSEETQMGTDPTDADSDDDGLTDAEEIGLGTDPLLFDSDADSVSDGQEVAAGTDPNDPYSNATVSQSGVFEVPALNATASGIGLFSGWKCEASSIEIELPNGTRMPAAYGTDRLDTRAVCGDADNGFSLLFNFNNLGAGEHTIKVLAGGEEFARTTFRVVQLSSGEFLRGQTATTVVEDFPRAGHSVTLTWDEAAQNFKIQSEETPNRAGTRYRPVE